MDLLNSFGVRVFNDNEMKNHLPYETYKSLKKSIELSLPLASDVAYVVAPAMKDWAIKNGATHYTHWFQPMTGVAAGKYDGFINLKDGKPIVEFSGKCLIKGEPDASSFPSGGLRNTFEARGYTIWDCTSPAFVKGKTLYIPTAFCSYTGEALDTKTPLLKSMEVISQQSVRILKIFGDELTTAVIPTVGAEQEYFLIDREDYEKRLDLKICGRTLFGRNSVKGQEMDDHYCSRIRLRVSEYMNQLDEELWAFGICAKTKHNEAAPSQHEMAPVFESCNLAADHNQLIMETMRVVAKKNKLACLLHEKPFSNVNGSGKHNNWSLSKNDGTNLFEVGQTKKDNMQFLVFLSAVIRGFSLYSGLLRMSSASAGNDNRLGGNEAPPSIMSIFLGKHLYNILHDIASGKDIFGDNFKDMFITRASTLPNFLKDDSDRNRTSPFAFTGNKFEFRMLGSSASISLTTTIMNLIVAESLEYFADILEKENKIDRAVSYLVCKTFKDHGKVIFNGNNYSIDWEKEAKKRNLNNIKDTVEAAKEYIKKENVSLFEHFNVFSINECSARYEIMLENYCETICIEANTMLEIVCKEIFPAIVKYLNELTVCSKNINGILNKDNSGLVFLIKLFDESLSNIANCNREIKNMLETIKDLKTPIKKAEFARDSILNAMKNLRKHVDDVEQYIPKGMLKIPSITELLHKV